MLAGAEVDSAMTNKVQSLSAITFVLAGRLTTQPRPTFSLLRAVQNTITQQEVETFEYLRQNKTIFKTVSEAWVGYTDGRNKLYKILVTLPL